MEADPAIHHGAQAAPVAGLECLHVDRVHFGRIARRVDAVVQSHEHALAARRWFGADHEGVPQVARAVRIGRGCVALRTGEHHGLVAGQGEIEVPGSLLQRGRAVRHHHPLDVLAPK